MWGEGARDEYHIASWIQRLCDYAGYTVEVTNFAQDGYVSTAGSGVSCRTTAQHERSSRPRRGLRWIQRHSPTRFRPRETVSPERLSMRNSGARFNHCKSIRRQRSCASLQDSGVTLAMGVVRRSGRLRKRNRQGEKIAS